VNTANLAPCTAGIVGVVAMMVVVLAALALMLRILKPADALKGIVAILGIAVTLSLLPVVLIAAWSRLSVWQQLGLSACGLGALLLLRPRRRRAHKKQE
jgi:hypothetical protein